MCTYQLPCTCLFVCPHIKSREPINTLSQICSLCSVRLLSDGYRLSIPAYISRASRRSVEWGHVNTIDDRQKVTERCQKMTLYVSIENWLCVENIKQAVSEVPQHTEEIQFFTLYFDIVHSAQSDTVRTVTNHLHVQIMCKNTQCVYK
jgi:hypothetical protein